MIKMICVECGNIYYDLKGICPECGCPSSYNTIISKTSDDKITREKSRTANSESRIGDSIVNVNDIKEVDRIELTQRYDNIDRDTTSNFIKTVILNDNKREKNDIQRVKANKENNNFPKFTEQYILDLLNTSITYYKGQSYFRQKRVQNLSWNEDCSVFTSIVSGTMNYNCYLLFKGNYLIEHRCSCPAHYNYSGPCKHIVATMLAINELALPSSTKNTLQNVTEKTINETSKQKTIETDIKNAKSIYIDYLFNRDIKEKKKTKISNDNQVVKENSLSKNVQRKQEDNTTKKKEGQNLVNKEKKVDNSKRNEKILNTEDEKQKNDEEKSDLSGKIFLAILIIAIIFFVGSFFSGWMPGALGAFLVLVFLFFLGVSSK